MAAIKPLPATDRRRTPDSSIGATVDRDAAHRPSRPTEHVRQRPALASQTEQCAEPSPNGHELQDQKALGRALGRGPFRREP
jgi:hypothetical protein